MKNKEFYQEQLEALLVEEQTHEICKFKKDHVPECKEACDYKHCHGCMTHFRNWLNEEHVEPIKLLQWEYFFLKFLREEKYYFLSFNYDLGQLAVSTAIAGPTYCDKIMYFVPGVFKGLKDKPEYVIDDILNNCTILGGSNND